MTHPGYKDAIHVPYVMVKCNVDLQPGDKCSLRSEQSDMGENSCVRWNGEPRPMWHGVADPFLEAMIPAGELFACHIRNECFRGLRHDFVIEDHDQGGTDTCHQTCDLY